jgi:hypothetical protein
MGLESIRDLLMIFCQGLIQDFFVEGGNSCTWHGIQTRGVWGHAPPENFEILQPLRLFLVASETTYTNEKLLYIILLHSTIYISVILGKFQGGGGEIPGCPPPCINPCLFITDSMIKSVALVKILLLFLGIL